MGLLRILRRLPKRDNLLDEIAGYDKLVKGYEVLVRLQQVMMNENHKDGTEESNLTPVDGIDQIPEPKAKKVQPRRNGKPFFPSKKATADLIGMFNRRNNKWLTKKQIQTMVTSPLKGIPHSSFYRVIEAANVEVDRSKIPHKYRLGLRVTKQSKTVIPAAPKLYGASLTTIDQQLKGTKTPVTLHGIGCRWHKWKVGEWLYADTLPELRAKITKLFSTFAKGKTPVIQNCKSCVKEGRVPTN